MPGADTFRFVIVSPSSGVMSGKGRTNLQSLVGVNRETLQKVNSQLFCLDLTKRLGAQQPAVPASAKANLLGTHKPRTCHISAGPFQGSLVFGSPTLPGLRD